MRQVSEQKPTINSKRYELLSDPYLHSLRIQSQLFVVLRDYMTARKLDKKAVAAHLGQKSNRYVTQTLNGNFDFKLSFLIKLLTETNTTARIMLVDLDEYIAEDKRTRGRKPQDSFTDAPHVIIHPGCQHGIERIKTLFDDALCRYAREHGKCDKLTKYENISPNMISRIRKGDCDMQLTKLSALVIALGNVLLAKFEPVQLSNEKDSPIKKQSGRRIGVYSAL